MPRSRKPIGENGQTLLELALVLFGFCSAVFIIVQTVMFCWNQVEIQRMAQVAGNDLAASSLSGLRSYFWRNRLWGHTKPIPVRRIQRTAFNSARSYRGVSTHDFGRQLRLAELQVAGDLIPSGGWVPRLLLGKQQSTVQTLIEPAIPGEMTMRARESGQLLMPMLGLLLLFGIFLAGFVRQCRYQYWTMKMDVAAKAATLSAMREQAAIMNTLSTCQMANALFAIKVRWAGTDYAYSLPPQRQLFERWNTVMQVQEFFATVRITRIAYRLARENGADGTIVPLWRPSLQLQWMPLTFIHVTAKPPFFETEIRPRSFLVRTWKSSTEKAQPDHKQAWRVCHEKVCGYAWATLWLDVKQSDPLHNGGFPQKDPSYFRSISFQSFYPQFNAELMARSPRR